jgi:hypothetical protein
MVTKGFTILFQSAILENVGLDFHEQSWDILDLYMLSQTKDTMSVSQIDEASFPYGEHFLGL